MVFGSVRRLVTQVAGSCLAVSIAAKCRKKARVLKKLCALHKEPQGAKINLEPTTRLPQPRSFFCTLNPMNQLIMCVGRLWSFNDELIHAYYCTRIGKACLPRWANRRHVLAKFGASVHCRSPLFCINHREAMCICMAVPGCGRFTIV